MSAGPADPAAAERMRRLLPWLALDAVGAICLAFGVAGATSTSLHGVFPLLADKDNAWRLAGLGVLLMVLAVPAILKILRLTGRKDGDGLPPGASR